MRAIAWLVLPLLLGCSDVPVEAPPDAGTASLSLGLYEPLPGQSFSLAAGAPVPVVAIVVSPGGPATAAVSIDGVPLVGAEAGGSPAAPSWRLDIGNFSAIGPHTIGVTVNAGDAGATAARSVLITP